MKVSDRMIVTIDSLDHQGRGIVHLDNQVIFVFGALPLEEVEIEVMKVKKKIVEAKLIDVLKPSKDRIESKCPYFHDCGGCDLLHMTYENQLKYKENKIKEIMKKFAGIEGVVTSIVANEQVFSYRNKVIFQVDEKIGFYKKKSNQIIEVDACLLLNQEMNQILTLLKETMNVQFVNQIMMRYSDSFQECLLLFDVQKEFKESQIPLEKFTNDSVILKRDNDYKVLHGNSFLLEQVGGYTFKISPASFFQVNTRQMEKLYQTVLDYSELKGKEKVLDLYCGTGSIGIFLSSKASKVLGIEINESAVKDAIWNQHENHIENIQFICGDTGTVLKETSFSPDLVVVDPPRAGLDELAIAEVLKIQSPKLIYVSCDPVTLARDIKRLESLYEVKVVVPVDMFSNTYHVECVCVMNRRN